MSTPKTSVIMPIHNAEDTVVTAIKSVLEQTDQDFELILVDDLSTDSSRETMQIFLAEIQDPRIQYFENVENMGTAATRNAALDIAQGEWVSFLDSDDQYHPQFLEKLHAAVSEDIDVVGGAHDSVSDGMHRLRLVSSSATMSGHDAVIQFFNGGSTPFACDKIFRVSALAGLRFPNLRYTEDQGFTVTAYTRARNVRYIEDSLYWYTVNLQSVTWKKPPPLVHMYNQLEYLKQVTGFHHGNKTEQGAFAAIWCTMMLNAAQRALRTSDPKNPDIKAYIRECQTMLRPSILVKAAFSAPRFAAGSALLRLSPASYKALYSRYTRKTYGL